MNKLYLTVLCCLMIACGDSSNKPAEVSVDVNEPELPADYIETGDIRMLSERGVVRFLVPKFDGADALPRDGVAVQAYQVLADQFAEDVGLESRWVFVDKFSDLIPYLNEGKGDVIVTNLTKTKARSQQVAFARPINIIKEKVVSKSLIESLDDISSLSVPAGTAYLESIKDKLGDEFPVEILPSDMSDSAVLEAIHSGVITASILDSNVLDILLLDYPDLKVGPTLQSKRSVGWAVRKQNPELLKAINHFLVSHHVEAAGKVVKPRSWEEIKQSGRLRMLTLNNPASYFMWKGELMGFDFDLLQKFSRDQGLHLSVTMKEDREALFKALTAGEGDIAAASITITDDRKIDGLAFTRPYLKLNEQLLTFNDSVDDLNQITGGRLAFNPETSFKETAQYLADNYGPLELVEKSGYSTEALVDALPDGEFDYVLTDGHFAKRELAYRDDLKAIEVTDRKANIGWMVRDESDGLKQVLDSFIKKKYRGLFYNITFNKYFKNQSKMLSHRENRVSSGEALSPYDDLVKGLAAQYNLDWRMVIAQMYQESKFNPKAVSFAGAKGLMQVMPRTGKEFGFTNLEDPQVGIEAGIRYLNWLEDRFPEDLHVGEKIYFVLASYNAGAGHVRDARKLADKMGWDRNKWFGHTEKAMLLLSDPKYYKPARFGYVRGKEPVNYVREIRQRYLSYIDAARH